MFVKISAMARDTGRPRSTRFAYSASNVATKSLWLTVSACAKSLAMRRAPARAWRADQSHSRLAPVSLAPLASDSICELTQRDVKTSTGTAPSPRVS